MAEKEPTTHHLPAAQQQELDRNLLHHQQQEEIQEEEEVDEEEKQQQQVHHHRDEPKSRNPNPTPRTSSPRNALAFWAYLTLSTAALTLLLSLLRPQDERAWFLSLPAGLRLHYSAGRLLKDPRHPHPHVFALDLGPRPAPTLLLLHGLASSSFSFRRVAASLAARGLRAVALDLPASGFSDPLPGAAPRGLLSVAYRDVRDKGIFWAFDQLVEKGFVEHEEVGGVVYGAEEVGGVVGRAVGELGLERVHLVLHDSAAGPGARWAAANRGRVGSVSFIDAGSSSAAFPSWMLGVPVLRGVLLGFAPVFRGLLRLCCARGVDEEAAEAYRMMLKGKTGQWGVVDQGKGLNFSFDLGEWATSEEVRGLPMLVMWSHAWTDLWIEEGRRIASTIPDVKFVWHFGGRWPQEDAAEEVADKLADFISSLPKLDSEVQQEPLPELIKEVVDEAGKKSRDKQQDQHHHHDHGYEHMGINHHHGHDHEQMAGVGAYPGWGI